MSSRLAFAVEAAVSAGRMTLGYFQKGIEVATKSDDSPVTAADRRAERMIREAIESAYPGESILGEEEGLSGGGDTRWVIDPIDGTKAFVCGVPLYATLLSYEIEEVPEVAVCYFPALDDLVIAERGQGCQWNGKPCRVSHKRTLAEAAVSTGSLTSLGSKGREEAFFRLSNRTFMTRTWSDAFGHALVATGRIEAMVDPVVKRWDLSAMSLLVEEAGGRFTDLSGNAGIHGEAISSNGLVHDALVEVLRA